MTKRIRVQIVGARVACADGMKDTWREVAEWAAGQLTPRYGEAIEVEYYDLFDPGAPAIPPGAQLPLVVVDGDVITQGGKVSIPAIRRRVDSMIAPDKGHASP